MCFGGASGTEKQISQEQSQFYQGLTNNYATQFKGQQAILGQLSSAFSPILAQGINQYGFGGAEDSALRTQATQGTAQQYKNARQATGESLAAVGGGNTLLPSGTAAGLQAQNAVAAANQMSNQQLGITTAGYEQGRQNFLNAASGLSGVASQMNPTAYAGAANTAGTDAFSSADTVNQEEQAAKQAEFAAAAGLVTGGITGGLGSIGAIAGAAGGLGKGLGIG